MKGQGIPELALEMENKRKMAIIDISNQNSQLAKQPFLSQPGYNSRQYGP